MGCPITKSCSRAVSVRRGSFAEALARAIAWRPVHAHRRSTSHPCRRSCGTLLNHGRLGQASATRTTLRLKPTALRGRRSAGRRRRLLMAERERAQKQVRETRRERQRPVDDSERRVRQRQQQRGKSRVESVGTPTTPMFFRLANLTWLVQRHAVPKKEDEERLWSAWEELARETAAPLILRSLHSAASRAHDARRQNSDRYATGSVGERAADYRAEAGRCQGRRP